MDSIRILSNIIFIIFCLQTLTFSQVSRSLKFSKEFLKLNKITADDGIEYLQIKMNEFSNSEKIGEPDLPIKYIRLIIPSEMDINNIDVQINSKETIEIDADIYPTQPGIPTSDKFQSSKFIKGVKDIYEASNPYPQNIVQQIHSGYYDGNNHIVTLAIYPIQYIPREEKIIFISELRFEINMQGKSNNFKKVITRSVERQKDVDKILSTLIDNPEDLSKFQIKPINLLQENQIETLDYVIITTSSLAPALEDFVNWKKRKGLKVLIKPINEILAEYPNGDLISGISDASGSIRQYLSDLYYNNGLIYALFAGKKEEIPFRYGCGDKNKWWRFTVGDDIDHIPADLYFSDFTGDWNIDGDEYFGEVRNDDGVDYYPEIFVGRILFQSQQEILDWTKKLIEYEQNPFSGSFDKLTKILWSEADELQQMHQPTLVKSYSLIFNNLNHTILSELPSYASIYPDLYFPSGADIIRELNNGYHFYNIYNHGAPTHALVRCPGNHATNLGGPYYGIFTYDSFNLGYVDEVGNGLDNIYSMNKSNIIYSIGCDNSQYENPEGYRCMSDVFTILNNSGGVAFLGNTRVGWVGSSYFLHQKFISCLYDNTIYNIGKTEAISRSVNGDMKHYLSYTHNLFGDPEMPIWTTTPLQFNNVTVVDNGTSITVNTGITGSTICAYGVNTGNDFHYSIENVSSYTFSTSIRPLYITVTKQNYIPYSGITSGSITSNTTFYGNIKIVGNLTVNNLATLNIQPGTIIKFSSGASLVSNGKLIAQGTSTEPITFTSDGSTTPGSWGSIQLQNSGANGSIIENANITYGTELDLINTNNVAIKNCTILNSSLHGINVSGGSGNSIVDNIIENTNLHHGIIVQNGANASCLNNKVKKTNSNKQGVGIYFGGGASGTVARNDINGFNWGVCANWESSPSSFNSYPYPYINNRIKNCYYGVMVYRLSYPILGVPTDPRSRNNSIYDNNLNVSVAQSYPDFNSSLTAYGNWWGSYPPNTALFSVGPNGTFTYANYLSSDPWGGSTQINEEISSIEENPADVSNYLYNGIKLRDEKKYKEATDFFKEYIKNNPEEHSAYVYLYSCADHSTIREITDFFKLLSKNALKENQILLSYLYLKQNMVLQAIEVNNNIIMDNPNTSLSTMAKLNNFYIELYNKQNKSVASDILKEIKNQSDHEFALELSIAENALYPNISVAKMYGLPESELMQEDTTKDLSPTKYDLLQNFPNPFNPTTQIEYYVPINGLVSIKVYNILGVEIATLVNEFKSKGKHTINFDSSDLPSGVYVYCMNAKNYIQTKKMILVK